MFFFFKQKTAYEIRISDWSSDVCSSDLAFDKGSSRAHRQAAFGSEAPLLAAHLARGHSCRVEELFSARRRRHQTRDRAGREGRSEEHTSELQSLMRISYAVFCLKKKNKYKDNASYNTHTTL